MSGGVIPSIFDGDDDARSRFEALELEFRALDRNTPRVNNEYELPEEFNTTTLIDVAKRLGKFIGRNSVRLYTRPSFTRVWYDYVDGRSVRTTTHAKSKIIGRLGTPQSEMSQFKKTGERHFSIARTLISLGIIAFTASSISQPFVENDQPSVDDVVQIIKEHWPGKA